MPLRRAEAEDRFDFKTLYYQEDGNRMRVIAPTTLFEKELQNAVTIRIEGIYNDISGATPTGAPPTPAAQAPLPTYSQVVRTTSSGSGGSSSNDDDESESEGNEEEGGVVRAAAPPAAQGIYSAVSGATSAPKPKPSSSSSRTTSSAPAAPAPASAPTSAASGKVPTAQVEDIRFGVSLELSKRIDRHTPAVQFSYSAEKDYTSYGLALRDAIDFNRKNTTLLLGTAFNHDLVAGTTFSGTKDKDSVDFIAGLTQVLDPRTLFTANLSLGFVDGYLTDPYKVVELNGRIVPEKRPDNKDKQILFLSLTRYFELVKGSLEGSYRRYEDSFGISANTCELAWYQKLGPKFILRPAVRYYDQNEADFHAVRFSGSPEFYSSDYRVSSFESWGYGLKLIWTPNERFSGNIGFERYTQQGKDGITPDDAYPQANLIYVGLKWAL
jgi:hypothetical protein